METYYRDNAYKADSIKICAAIAESLRGFGFCYHGALVKPAAFLIQAIDAPSVYVETCFIDNDGDFAKIEKPESQWTVGGLIAAEILKLF